MKPFLMRLSVALVAAVVLTTGGAGVAGAIPNGVSYNALGWHNTDGWGNFGATTNVEWVAAIVGQYRNNTGDRPWSIGFQELCADSDVNLLDQFQYLQFTMGTHDLTGAFSGPNTNPDHSAYCTKSGIAVFGWQSLGTWFPTQVQPYNDNTSRRYICVHPTLNTPFGPVNYKACTTHLRADNDSGANTELGIANDGFEWAITNGTRTTFSGDLNLSPKCNIQNNCGQPYSPELDWWIFNWNNNHFESAPNGLNFNTVTYPTFGGQTTQKLDYFGRSYHFGSLSSPTILQPACCLFLQGNDKPYSDHKYVRAYVG